MSRRRLRAGRRRGAPHGTRLFVQLFHGGRELIACAPRPPALSSSAVPSPRFHTEPRAATAEDIAAILDGYARSAAAMAEAGLDGIEVTAAHGYLAEQFFTPGLNRREDDWAEPLRFLTEVLEAVRGAAPGLALGVRLSADSEAARTAAAGWRVGSTTSRRARRVGDLPRRSRNRAAAAGGRERDRGTPGRSGSGRR